MHPVPTWLLLLVLSGVWVLWAVAATVEHYAREARRGVPQDQRGGISILPVIPLYPLVFWGMARLLDGFSSWGSAIIVSLHVLYALGMFATLWRDVRFLRKYDRRASS